MRPPLRCAPGASVSRGRSAGTPQAAVHAGDRSPAGVPRPMRAAVHTGPQPSRAFRRPRPTPPAAHAGHRPRRRSAGLPQAAATRGASAPAGVPQVSRRPPHTRGIGLPRGFRGPPAGVPRPTQVAARAGPRSSQAPAGVPRPPAGVPQASRRPSPHAGHRPPEGVPHASRRPRPPSPPAARFSRKPPCGIGSRMVYCT